MPIPRIPTGDEFIAPEDYTINQFNTDIVDIILRFPESVNPTDEIRSTNDGDPGCLYFKDGARCLIGQWLHERGHAYDITWDTDTRAANWVLKSLGYPEDLEQHACAVQARADQGVPWRNLLTVKVNESVF